MEMTTHPESRSEGPDIVSLRRRAQVFLTLFIIGLTLWGWGLTAIPIRTEAP